MRTEIEKRKLTAGTPEEPEIPVVAPPPARAAPPRVGEDEEAAQVASAPSESVEDIEDENKPEEEEDPPAPRETPSLSTLREKLRAKKLGIKKEK
jgi:hypothetical protein